MANFDDTPTVATPLVPNFQLTPPEVITPVPAEASRNAVPLKPDTVSAVDEQVARFIDALMNEDVHGAAFKSKLDSAFALGREEISHAASLMQGRFLQRNFVGAEDSPAYKAIGEIRGQLDKLNPGNEGDLLAPNKILGIIPFGNKLKAYFRKFESAGSQLQKSMSQLYAARDDVQRDIVDIEATRAKLWDAMQKLAAAAHFATTLDSRLAERVNALQATDPQRAQALQQEVLFYARQNLSDILTQQAVCVNGYLALDVLKKTGREMMNGCSRVATTGMSALAVAQTVARATGNQVQVMEMLQGVNSTIGNLISETGRALNTHVDKTAEFASNPLVGIEKIKEMFDQTYKAMDAMDSFRAKAITVMGQNNTIMAEQLTKSQQYIDRVRQQQAREAGGA
ncbi:MAG TPA: toxic anion resistance protein [Rhizobacter sp.]|nr:toxic anion resistance protein [Rhizobacter sp.]